MNIINALPGIVPTARSFTMGQWPQKRVKMRNGRTVRWALCNKPSNDTMDLAWENITYAQAEQICIVWDNSYGIYGHLSQAPTARLTPEILAGTSGELNRFLASPFRNAVWRFVSRPQVKAAKAGRCTVTITIKTEPGGNGGTGGESPEWPATYRYVRWRGIQRFAHGYGGIGGAGEASQESITTSWLPLQDAQGGPITYGLGGLELDGEYNAIRYLGPWSSNIRIYRPTPSGAGIGGSVDGFYVYAESSLAITGGNSNYGFAIISPPFSSATIAESSGVWEFADQSLQILEAWEGYSIE